MAKRVFSPLLEWVAKDSVGWIESHIQETKSESQSVTPVYTQIVARVIRSERVAEALMRFVEQRPELVCALGVHAGLMEPTEYEEAFGDEPPRMGASDLLREHLNGEKFELFSNLVEDQSVLVHLDPRHYRAKIPEQFCHQSRLVLRLGHNLNPPCEGFKYDHEHVEAVLSFGGTPFRCWVPWEAVFVCIGTEDGEARVWPESAPSDLEDMPEDEPSRADGPVEAAMKQTHVPHLKLVE